MKYVLDASVALKWVLPKHDSGSAVALRDAFRIAVHELLAPDVFIVEIAHSSARAERKELNLSCSHGLPLEASERGASCQAPGPSSHILFSASSNDSFIFFF